MITHLDYPEHVAFAWDEHDDGSTDPAGASAPPTTPKTTGTDMDNSKYQAGVYAIKDTVANILTGGLYAHKHEAAAVRFFCDVASMKDSLVGKHPQDFDLLRLGYITHNDEIVPDLTTVLKGSTFAAATTENETDKQTRYPLAQEGR